MTIINDVSISHRWDRVGDRGLDPLKKTVDKCKDFNHIYNTGEAESSLLSSFARPKSPAVSMQKYISLDNMEHRNQTYEHSKDNVIIPSRILFSLVRNMLEH